jgi:esterase
MKLNYKKTGNGAPLIILHGLFGSADNWLSIAKDLTDHFTLYLLDQRNHGDSPHTEEWNYEVMSNDILELMEEEGLDAAHLMGHSMGGKTAMKFAVSHPEKVNKLIVADISPRFYPIHHQQILEGLNAIPVQKLSSRKEAEDILATFIPDLGTRQFLLKSLTRDGGNFKWKINLQVITEKIANVGEALDADQPFEKPVLFMAGENSNYIQENDKAEIAKHFPNYKLVTIKNAGHWLHAEQPQAVVETIKAFL